MAQGLPFQVNTSTTASYRNPRIAANESGASIVVWGDASSVFARRFDASGTPLGSDILLTTVFPGGQRQPATAINAVGQSTVVWASTSTGYYQIFAQNFAADGTFFGPPLEMSEPIVGAKQEWPAVAMLGFNQYIVAWTDSRGGDNDIFGRLVWQP